ncbi:MAG: hypothetical protein FD127_3250 [Acidimicrobiaceae bacterium]|nr:MAG: hypothetical protein FD127_3250 [Acidimicrobiaceae bacterium]
MLLAALLTWQFGEDRARGVLEAHEYIRDGELLNGQDFDNLRMTDLINNELGIALGLQSANEFGGPVRTWRFRSIENAVLSNPTIVYFRMAG